MIRKSVSAYVGYVASALFFLSALIALFLPWQTIGWLLVMNGIVCLLLAIRRSKMDLSQAESSSGREMEVALLQVELAQQQSEIDSMGDGVDVAIFICDPKGIIIYANRRSREMFKFETPRNRSLLAVTLSTDLEQLVLSVKSLQERQSAEITFTHPENRVGRVVAWQNSGHTQTFVSVYEITDLKRLERVRQDFVANVSHELRTPLTIIRAAAETVNDDPKLEEIKIRKFMDRIMTEVDRLSLITNDLLILSSAESSPMRKHACNLASVWRNSVASLTDKAQEKGLEIRIEGPKEILVEANEIQMTQVAMNLIENAINYTASGYVSCTLGEDGSNAIIEVEDSGSGISVENQERIFERFYRVDKARSRNTGGTGLGLSIVRHIVEVHGGTVKVESELNQGAKFVISLPIGNPMNSA